MAIRNIFSNGHLNDANPSLPVKKKFRFSGDRKSSPLPAPSEVINSRSLKLTSAPLVRSQRASQRYRFVPVVLDGTMPGYLPIEAKTSEAVAPVDHNLDITANH